MSKPEPQIQKINLTNQYQTRDGCEVKLLMIADVGSHPVIGAVRIGEIWNPACWAQDGRWISNGESSPRDLMPAKKKGVAWLNVYPDNDYSGYASRRYADQAAVETRLACVRVEWVEGQFDE